MKKPHQLENWPGTTIVSHPTTGSTIRHSEVHTDIRVVDTEGAEGAKGSRNGTLFTPGEATLSHAKPALSQHNGN